MIMILFLFLFWLLFIFLILLIALQFHFQNWAEFLSLICHPLHIYQQLFNMQSWRSFWRLTNMQWVLHKMGRQHCAETSFLSQYDHQSQSLFQGPKIGKNKWKFPSNYYLANKFIQADTSQFDLSQSKLIWVDPIWVDQSQNDSVWGIMTGEFC